LNLINASQLPRGYGHQRGVFDLNFSVAPGEVFGFLGPNGAGKTTTIRHLMGFLQPEWASAASLILIAGVNAPLFKLQPRIRSWYTGACCNWHCVLHARRCHFQQKGSADLVG
jgi:ABC-type lipopolysaccharide export system ATPase subunit